MARASAVHEKRLLRQEQARALGRFFDALMRSSFKVILRSRPGVMQSPDEGRKKSNHNIKARSTAGFRLRPHGRARLAIACGRGPRRLDVAKRPRRLPDEPSSQAGYFSRTR